MTRLPALPSLALTALLLASLPACGGLWGGQRTPSGVSLIQHDMAGDTVAGLSVGSGQLIELTLVVSSETDAFELWAHPTAGTVAAGVSQLVAVRSNVAGQVIGILWSTDTYAPGPYDLVAVLDDGSSMTIAERIDVR
jgi:hypothetical protein